MEETVYDVVIVGGGPAGLTAAIYTSRRAMKTLVITKDIGGQLSLTDDVENYPGFESIAGLTLSQKFQEQAAKTGTEFLFDEVVSLEKQTSGFVLKTFGNKTLQARAIVLAFGLTPRDLGVPGEKELTGRGITYCATCDGPLYRGKDVVVIGGGNSALDAAEYLSKVAKKVYMLVRGEAFRGEQVLIDKVKAADNIEVIFQAVSKEIKGKNRVESLLYESSGKINEIMVDGIFIEIGHMAKTAWLKTAGIDLTQHDEIKVNQNNETSLPGVFAAGDVTDVNYKQAIISAGEGSKAALQAYKYLQGDKPLLPDWKINK